MHRRDCCTCCKAVIFLKSNAVLWKTQLQVLKSGELCWLGLSSAAPTQLVLMSCFNGPALSLPSLAPTDTLLFLPFLLLVLFSDGELLSVRLPGALLWCLSLKRFPPTAIPAADRFQTDIWMPGVDSFLASFHTLTPTPSCRDTSAFYEKCTCVSMTCVCVCVCRWVTTKVLTHQAKGSKNGT